MAADPKDTAALTPERRAAWRAEASMTRGDCDAVECVDGFCCAARRYLALDAALTETERERDGARAERDALFGENAKLRRITPEGDQRIAHDLAEACEQRDAEKARADAARAEEREACATRLDEIHTDHWRTPEGKAACVAAIRARKP